MEGFEEAVRLEVKTDHKALRAQAEWCGIGSGLRVLDVGCGPGKTSSVLRDMVQPGGEVLGVDFSTQRIERARQKYGEKPGLDFQVHNFYDSLEDFGLFDRIWVRFVLEYHRKESPGIVSNLVRCLKPGGYLCLIDLDHNALNHYPLPGRMEHILFKILALLEEKYDFDPYAGRKLYSYLFDQGLEQIQADIRAHHLIYGKVNDVDMFNWIKKLEMVTDKAPEVFEDYPGGHLTFFDDFNRFFKDPRRFTYTPMILCKGMKKS
ncbi:MAG: class I SAM-dependent methyltransferase [Desulfatiglandaceae bacterium]